MHQTIFPPVCFEAGKRYKVKVEFRRSNAQQDLPSASILIDSVSEFVRLRWNNIYSWSIIDHSIYLNFFLLKSISQCIQSLSFYDPVFLQIMLIPRTEKLPFYTGTLENDNLRQEFEYYRCRDSFYTGDFSTLPELCQEDHLDSIGFYVYGQAFSE